MGALIQMAGYPSQDIATMAVPFWQSYLSLMSQKDFLQVCSVPLPTLALHPSCALNMPPQSTVSASGTSCRCDRDSECGLLSVTPAVANALFGN